MSLQERIYEPWKEGMCDKCVHCTMADQCDVHVLFGESVYCSEINFCELFEEGENHYVDLGN